MGLDRCAIEFRPSAARALSKVDAAHQQRIRGAVALLARDPRPPSARRLKGREAFRIRVGDHRVIYSINDRRLVILAIAVYHRSQVNRT